MNIFLRSWVSSVYDRTANKHELTGTFIYVFISSKLKHK